jgi:8-oxo-dGTP diphosphatase
MNLTVSTSDPAETIHTPENRVTPDSLPRVVSLSDQVVRTCYKLAYWGHLAASFFLRPKTRGAYVAVWRDDRILLIRNSYKSTYSLPCGGIGRREEPMDAARRELLEEVGLDLPVHAFRLVYETVNRTEFKQDHIFLYEVRVETSPSLSVDGREVVWAGFRGFADALEMPLFPPVRDYLLQSASHFGKR